MREGPGPRARRVWAGGLTAALVASGLAGAWALLPRVEVTGASMTPTLEPGDRLVVVRLPVWWPLQLGELVALRDPRRRGDHRALVLAKRVTGLGPLGVSVGGDNPPASTDSRDFGPVPRPSVLGRIVYRYAPAARAGLVR